VKQWTLRCMHMQLRLNVNDANSANWRRFSLISNANSGYFYAVLVQLRNTCVCVCVCVYWCRIGFQNAKKGSNFEDHITRTSSYSIMDLLDSHNRGLGDGSPSVPGALP